MTDCASFAAKLIAACDPGGSGLRPLADDPHARACAVCRASLAREVEIERALSAQDGERAPAGLASRMAERLAPSRDVAAIGPWLDLALERVDVPAGLELRVRAGLELRLRAGLSSRVRAVMASASRAAIAPGPRRVRRMWLAVAALVVVALGAWWLRAQDRARLDDPGDALLARLELLEDWDLLVGDAGDEATFLGALDELDLLWIEYAAWAEEPVVETSGVRRG